jgi:hypothetical protein
MNKLFRDVGFRAAEACLMYVSTHTHTHTYRPWMIGSKLSTPNAANEGATFMSAELL